MEPAPEQTHAPSPDAAHQVGRHVKGYLLVGLGLLGCMGLTVWLSFVNFGPPSINIAVVLVLAAFQAGCAAAIFMHLKSEQWTIYRVLLVTLLFVICMFGLTALAFNDRLHLN